MAYDASNSQPDQNQVVSSTPLSGGQQPAAQPQPSDSQPSQAPSQPSTIQSGMSSTQAGAQQQPQQQKKSASSGMFTNIQRYVQKNQPQAQKMSQAVTKNVGSQASQIAQQAEQKQEQMKKSLAANQAAMAQQKEEAIGMVEQASGKQYDQETGTWGSAPAQPAPPVTDQPAPDQPVDPAAQEELAKQQQQRYQELMQGPTGVSEVGALNLGQQQQKARALQQLAGTAGTEQGRRGLLEQTFREGGDQYTSGMGSLDQLIVSGDEAARTGLVEGVQQQAEQLGEQLGDISQQSYEERMAQQEAMKRFGGEITGLGEQAMSAVDTDLETAYQQELENRAAITGDYEGAIASMENWKKDALAGLGNLETDQDIAKLLLSSGVDVGYWARPQLQNIASGADWRTRRSYVPRSKRGKVEPKTYQSDVLGRFHEGKFKNVINAIINKASFGGEADLGTSKLKEIWGDIWRTSSSNRKDKQAQHFRMDTIKQALNKLKSSIAGVDPTKRLESDFMKKTGQSLEDFKAGKDIDKYDTASEADIGRFDAIQKLLGKSQYAPEMRTTDYKSVKDAEEVLGQFLPDLKVKSGGTGSGGGPRR